MKISVIMGTYNGEKTIRQAVDSILRQDYPDFELIICDDCSSDNTFSILEELMERDNRIKVIRNTTNLKLAASLNRCLEIAQGEYIARMDDDDICLPFRFRMQVDFLDSHLEYAIVGSSIKYFSDNLVWGLDIRSGEVSVLEIFKGYNFIHPSVMMRTSALKKAEGYTVSSLTTRTEDYDLWCKLYALGYKGYNIKEILLLYREDLESIKKRKLQHRIDSFRLHLYWRKKLQLSLTQIPHVFTPLISGFIPQVILLKRRQLKGKFLLKKYGISSSMELT